MNKEIIILGETIINLYKKNKEALVEKLILKLKKNGQTHFLKQVLAYLKEKDLENQGLIKGVLKIAFGENDIDFIKEKIEKKLNKKIVLEKIKIDENLILGGLFLSKNYKIDFSYKNILNKIFNQTWKI